MNGRGLSLGAKLAMSTVAVLSIVSSLIFYELTTRARSNSLGSKRQAAELVSDLFGVTVVAPLDFGDEKDVQNTVENLRVNREITYAAVWRQGSPGPIATIGQRSPASLPSLGGDVQSETRISGDGLELVRRIERSDGTALGAVLIRFSLASVFAELQAAKRGMLIVTTGTAAVIALLILAVARWQIVLPLERLVVASRRLETGERGVTVDVAAHDEMGRLASAFNTMSAAIVDRERHLASATTRLRELFDNMRQGIIVFGRTGIVDEAPSKQAGLLFGPNVAGRRIEELFYADAPDGSPVRQAFEEWLAIAFDVPADRWGEFAALSPSNVQRKHAGASQWLELQFTPVVQEGRVERIMLLATDVTGQRRLEQATQTLEQQHAHQMGIMRRLVAGGGQVLFVLESAEERLAASLRQAGEPLLASFALTEILERVHTIRGEARTFELPELASECQGLERLLREVRDETLPLDQRPREGVVVRLGRARAAVARARELFIEASPIGPAVLDQMTVRKSDVRRLAEQLSTADGLVRRAIANLTSRPFGECITGVEAAAPRWAHEVGKQARVLVEGRDVRVPESVAPVLRAMLPHIIRNAIAHGIESPAKRSSLGKAPEGTMRLSAVDDGARLVVRIRDDGSGLDEAAIVAEGERLGLTTGAATELLFSAGVSTASQVGELAGQGIGLWAVREGLRKIGGDIRVRSEEGRGAEFEIIAPYAAD